MASLLKKFVDTEQWDAEDDIAGRLGMIMHAAFLFAGFQPYGAQPRSGHLLKKQSCKTGGSLCLSRQYTAPDLAHREGADAAVLMLCVQGDDVALLVFLTTDGGDDTPENAYMERMDLGTVRPLLSRSLGGVEPWASRICKSLADGVCWAFLDELCLRNGLPPLKGFTSLPDDLKGAVLEELTDGKDLARVECVSSQLRLLVAERDKLWETLYKALPARQGHRWCRLWRLFEKQETLNLGLSWKNKYVVETRRPSLDLNQMFHLNYHKKQQTIKGWCYLDSSGPIQMIRRWDLSPWPLFFSKGGKVFCHILVRRGKSSWPHEYWLFKHPTEEDHPMEKEEMVSMRVEQRGHRQKLAQNDCKKKWNGGGAIHSPSSRYRWKHR